MMRIDNLKGDELASVVRRTSTLETQAPVGYSSVSKGALRVRSAEGLIVEGSQRVSGTSSITGVQNVSGTQNVSGPLNVTGNSDFNGTVNIDGPLGVNGPSFLRGNLTLESGGQITVGPLIITPAGGISSASPVGIGAPALAVNDLSVFGSLTVDGAKNFRMTHPVKSDRWLMHGATESPVSGIEYWGEDVVGDDGETVVSLPDYFDALAKPQGRIVLVTGRGFTADWSDIDGGSFTVTGTPGKTFSWLVKAERFGGDFPVEPLREDGAGAPRVDDGSSADDREEDGPSD